MPHKQDYTIRIEVLENGFTVTVPDMDARAVKYAEMHKKNYSGGSYMGDLTESYAAKNVAEVMRFVKAALDKMPDTEYESAFKEATKEK